MGWVYVGTEEIDIRGPQRVPILVGVASESTVLHKGLCSHGPGS